MEEVRSRSVYKVEIDRIIRSRRRTIGLVITNEAKLIVRAPHWTPVHEIESMVAQKSRWIDAKKAFFAKRQARRKQYVEGEEFLFLGQNYLLRFVEDLPKALILDEKALMICQAVARNVQDHIGSWYQKEALEHISERVAFYAAQTGLSYRSVKVNAARTRWGSCSHTGALNFCWRLIMAPPRIVDYVVVHELMHLKQPNHSARFWAEVAQLVPDYRQDEQWLKENGHLLRL